ncbi:MAG: hypothetical protein JWO91_2101 [Acidobacteriaceae bacterium]|nr:hypothetical protein [Acidobacteriaceae bacterium]
MHDSLNHGEFIEVEFEKLEFLASRCSVRAGFPRSVRVPSGRVTRTNMGFTGACAHSQDILRS